MNSEMLPLPDVQSIPGETIARFKAVGVDSNGRTLYQKVEISEIKNLGDSTHVKKEVLESLISQSSPSDVKAKLPIHRRQFSKTRKQRELNKLAGQYENMTTKELKDRHDQSKQDYPEVTDLSDNEFVMVDIRRLPLATKLMWAGWLSILILVTSAWLIISSTDMSPVIFFGNAVNFTGMFSVIIALIDILILLFAYIGTRIYSHNHIFITNERVIQFQMNGLFDEKVQSINLAGVEDVSFSQKGIMSKLINYGVVRLSTIGDETTYQLTLVPRPNEVVKKVNGIIQAAKHGRLMPDTSPQDDQLPLI